MIFEIVSLTKFQNFTIRKIDKFIDFLSIRKTKSWRKKLTNSENLEN